MVLFLSLFVGLLKGYRDLLFLKLQKDCYTSEKVAGADYQELYEKIKKLNKEREIYKGYIGLHDMKLCVEAAKDVSIEIEY